MHKGSWLATCVAVGLSWMVVSCAGPLSINTPLVSAGAAAPVAATQPMLASAKPPESESAPMSPAPEIPSPGKASESPVSPGIPKPTLGSATITPPTSAVPSNLAAATVATVPPATASHSGGKTVLFVLAIVGIGAVIGTITRLSRSKSV